VPKKLLLYPERQRCRACRRFFGFVPILRQWCSEECAGVAYDLTTAPRSCKVRDREDPSGWAWKQVWWTESDAKRACRRKGAAAWYQCDGCWGYHLTKISRERWAELQDLRTKQGV
jgi:hypothetical protein